jgi:hypothetical protein
MQQQLPIEIDDVAQHQEPFNTTANTSGTTKGSFTMKLHQHMIAIRNLASHLHKVLPNILRAQNQPNSTACVSVH